MKYNLFILIFFSVFFYTCDQEIDFPYSNTDSIVVVEGLIESEKPSYVILTRSEHFFAGIDENTINNIFISDADVFVIRDDGIRHKLMLVNDDVIDIINTLFPNLQYTLPITNFYIDTNANYKDFSQAGRSYRLEVNWRGKTIFATTSIPNSTVFDSVWCECDQWIEDYKCYLWTKINDPDTIGNNLFFQYKRIETSSNVDDRFRICARFLRNDHLYNGLSFSSFFARSGQVVDEEGDGPLLPFYAKRNIDGVEYDRDVVLFKISEVDYATYNFLRTKKLQQEMDNNPFVQTTNLISNISGGLGIWSGYNSTYYKIPIVKDTVIKEKYEPELFEIF